jgi:hypothetical protein
MKNYIKISTLLFTVVLFLSFNTKTTPLPPVNVVEFPPAPIKFKITEIKLIKSEHQQFLDAIGFKESSNRYKVVNRYGYMGKYQFGSKTLKGLGFKLTKNEFLNTPHIQEKAMYKLLVHNKKKLRKYITKYKGKVVHGVLITESGILAAAHLGGQGNVRKFFRRGKVFKDGNGTKITHYMRLFGGYNLNL